MFPIKFVKVKMAILRASGANITKQQNTDAKLLYYINFTKLCKNDLSSYKTEGF
jgi:hypothetical protein